MARRGVRVSAVALAVAVVLVCVVDVVSAVPTARRIRSKTLQARSHAHAQRSHVHAAARAHAHTGTGVFACANAFIAKDPQNPLKQDQKFLSFCPASDKPQCKPEEEFTWKTATKNANQRSRMGMKRMIEWQTSYVQASFRYLIISASKAMSGWSQADKDWHKKMDKGDLPDVAEGKGWANKALIGHPKGMSSAWRKVRDTTADGYSYDFTRLVDAIRASFVFANAAHVEPAVCYFRQWLAADPIAKKHKCAIVQDKDRWTVPIAGGYSDFMLNMKCTWGDAESGPRDVIVELQFHSCAVLMAKQGAVGSIKNMFKDLPNTPFANLAKNGHKLYEEARVLANGNAQKATIEAQMARLYNEARALPEGKCDIEEAPKFSWEEGEEAEYEVYDLGKEVAAGKKWLHSKDYHSINWAIPDKGDSDE